MTLAAPPVAEPSAVPSARANGTGRDPGADEAPFTAAQWAIVVALTLLAAVLRVIGLADWPVWVDEAHTWRDATLPLGEFLEHSRRWYPTSYLALRGLLDLGILPGEGAGFLRLPFAVAGIATIPVLACYGRRMVGPVAALWAAAFLALHPWHVYWSQNARAYALVVLFATVAIGEFWRGRTERSLRRQVFGCAWLALAASCHLTGLVLVPVFGVVALLDSPRFGSRRTIVLLALCAALLLALEPLFELVPPLRVFLDAKGLAEPSMRHLVETVAWYFRVPFLAAAVVGAWLVVREKGEGRALPLLAWAVVPPLLLLAVSVGIVKVTGRYALAALPAVLLLAGAASARIGTAIARGLALGRRERTLAASVLPLLLVADAASGCALYFTVQNGDRGRWDEAAKVLGELAAGSPFVVHTTHEPVLLYYLQPQHCRGHDDPAIDVRSIETIDIDAAAKGRTEPGDAYLRSVLDDARQRGRRALFAMALPELREKDADGSLQRALAAQCELVRVLPLWVGPRDESIYVFAAR